MSIKFYEASHRYKMTLDPDGEKSEWAPGVTTIQNAATPKSLAPWGAETAARHIFDLAEKDALQPLLEQGLQPFIAWARQLPDQKRDRAGERGTSIHEYAEALVAGTEVDVPEELVGPVESAARFLDEWDIQPILTEPVIGNRTHWYCGKFDLLGESNSGVVLVDYKSGRRIYSDVAYQLEAYARAEFYDSEGAELPLPAMPDLHVVVHLTDEGYAVRPTEKGDDVWQDFLAMRRLYDGFKRARGSKTKAGYLHEPMSPRIGEAA